MGLILNRKAICFLWSGLTEMTYQNIMIDGIYELTDVHIDQYMKNSNGNEGERLRGTSPFLRRDGEIPQQQVTGFYVKQKRVKSMIFEVLFLGALPPHPSRKMT